MPTFSILALAAGLIGWPLAGAELRWETEPAGRSAALTIAEPDRTGFTLLDPSKTGITFTNTLEEWQGASNRVLFNGSGLATGDFDNDGWPDVFFCGLNTPNRLYRNLGEWRFKDVTEESGIVCPGQFFRGAVFADLNGDGALDLLVATTGQGVRCFQNDGRGKFSDVTAAARTGSPHGSMTLALADVDGNGTLDLYVANNRTDDMRDRGQVNLRLVNGKMAVPPELQDRLLVVNGQVLEHGEPDQLYLNDGRGRFTPVSWTGGRFRTEEGGPLTQLPRDWGLTAAFRDLNDDGFPDLYVCNDFWTPDRVWLNDNKGRFRAAPKLALRNMSASSMGVDFADIDRDGLTDFFVVDMLSRDPRLRKRQKLAQPSIASSLGMIEDRPQFMRNTLFLNRGDGTFAEIAHYTGLAASEWSWQPMFLDVDLDGYEDLLITSGHAKDVQDLDAAAQIRARQHSWKGFANEAERQRAFTKELMENMRFYPRLDTPIVAFRNRGDLHFEDVTAAWGTDQNAVHHAIALADFDRDGDLDFAVNNLGGAAGLYRNDTAAARVAVRLKGLPPNTQGIGAKVRLLGGAVTNQSQEVVSGGRYMSGSEPLLMFAAGKSAAGMTLEVTWRNQRLSRLTNVRANRLYEIEERSAASNPPGSITSQPQTANHELRTKLFQDASHLLKHAHHETPFDDFAEQSLLPFKLSQRGPGVAWADLDDDGAEELCIGSGRGGKLAAYRVTASGGFEPLPTLATGPLPDDTTGLVQWFTASGQRALLVGLAGYEDSSSPSLIGLRLRDGAMVSSNLFPNLTSSNGALAVSDFDGDGDLDLFAGGGPILGRYPLASPSRIYRCVGDRLELDQENTQRLAETGLVNGAVWSDLNQDGFAELILACEWGPIRILRNNRGRLEAWNAPISTPNPGLSTLDQLTGWWRGVTTGDLDGDGQLDIVAANWGLNSAYEASPQTPLRMHFGDFAERGGIDLIETEYDPIRRTTTPRRMLDALAVAMPFLREQYSNHKAFSETTVAELLGSRAARGQVASVMTLASTAFYNRGEHFNALALPREAQLAPAFSVNIADADGDGREDLFLSQNFFATQPEMPRLDAGRGLWLRGQGSETLEPMSARESGLEVYGEQRGAALADFDRDGRVDLVVAQNGAATKVFRNALARPGLRVRLAGPAGNPVGLGAILRLRFGERWGPVREIHGGSSYWSQESSCQVMSLPQPATAISVLWPGGKRVTAELPPQTLEITLTWDGIVLPAKGQSVVR